MFASWNPTNFGYTDVMSFEIILVTDLGMVGNFIHAFDECKYVL